LSKVEAKGEGGTRLQGPQPYSSSNLE